MPNRLDIELTSVRGDGSYTWRAAGARQPKGVIDAKILADSAKVGNVLRVEAEVEIDGITILSVLPSKEKAASPERIELIGSSKPVPAVTTVLLSEGGRGRGGDRRDLLDSPRRGDRSGSRDRPASRGAERGARRPQPGTGASEAPGERRPERRPRVDATPADGSSRPTEGRSATSGGERRPERRPRADATPGGASRTADGRPTASGGERRPRTATSARHPGAPAGERSGPDARPSGTSRPTQSQATRRTPPRFEPGTANRDLLMAGLAPEQRPIAERLAAGGIPAVRRAIDAERERARSEGRPEVTGEAILALAEQLAPAVKQATWLDRAEAAVAQLETISLRDLRTTVVAAAPRDEPTRDLDRKLREELDRRVKKLRSNWEEQITHALEEGRVLQALRFSAQPPEPTARFPAALVERLASSAGAAMSATTPVERWLAILDAAVASPIRRQIHPEGLPADPSGEVLRKARLAAGSLPALAPMLGLSMPPPPTPLRQARPPRPPRPPRPVTRASERAGSPRATTSAEAPKLATPPEVVVDDALAGDKDEGAPADVTSAEAGSDDVRAVLSTQVPTADLAEEPSSADRGQDALAPAPGDEVVPASSTGPGAAADAAHDAVAPAVGDENPPEAPAVAETGLATESVAGEGVIEVLPEALPEEPLQVSEET